VRQGNSSEVVLPTGTGKTIIAKTIGGSVLSQGEMLKDITEAAFVFGEFRTYQCSSLALKRKHA
jgi:hypothetical protein